MPTTVYRVTTSYVGGHGADGWRCPQLPAEDRIRVGRLHIGAGLSRLSNPIRVPL